MMPKLMNELDFRLRFSGWDVLGVGFSQIDMVTPLCPLLK